MASAGNPFASIPNGGANPFDPMGGGAATQPTAGGVAPGYGAQNPYQAPGAASAMQQYPNQPMDGMAGYQQPPQPPAEAQPDPWGAAQQSQPVPQQQQQQPPYQQQAPAYGQAPQYQQPPQSSAGGYDPFGASPALAAGGQMVVSHQQSNPYASAVAPTPPTPNPDYAAQAIVPAIQPSNPWGMPQQQAQPPPAYGVQPPAGTGGFDPFAPPPMPVPAPPPAHAPVAAPQPPVPAPQPAPMTDENPFGQPLVPAAPAPAPVAQESQMVVAQQQQLQQYSSERSDDPNSRAIVPAGPPEGGEARNKYAGELARRAPPGASPLPKAELVKKRGYVLSRISFRTIVMKKWKQSYWVQYGSHTMLWFRSQGDFDDWLNNPYHNQAQRNFLIKLAVNFVHDLYKPNVRGYQVTQCRVKPYGNKTVRQFKLERWMDYGPTIAAAFGAYDPKEVDALREAIVECMRNTPLDGGIRATGAVRQMPDSHNDGAPISYHRNSDQYSANDMDNRYNSGASAYTQPNPAIGHSQGIPTAARSVVSAADLLDDHNGFDDTASLPPSNAIVPSGLPQAYPGAPPPQQMNPFGAPQPPPQGYAQQQTPYGQAPPTPQPYQQVPAAPQYNAPPPTQQYQQAPPMQQYQQPPQAQAYQQAPPQQQQQYGYQQQPQQSYPF